MAKSPETLENAKLWKRPRKLWTWKRPKNLGKGQEALEKAKKPGKRPRRLWKM